MSMKTMATQVVAIFVALVAVFSSYGGAYAQEPAANDPIFETVSFEGPTKNVAVDSQGRAWYTLPTANKLAMMSVAGLLTYYPSTAGVMPADGQPYDLAIDGGTVWFTLLGANQIGKLDMSTGGFTFFPIPTADSQPTGISVGGGYVWFVERAGDKLGRLNPADGLITELYNWVVDSRNPVNMTDAELEDVAWSSSGIWITGPKFKNSVAVYKFDEQRFVPSPAGVGAAPMQVVVDSLENIWVTFSGKGKIGRSAVNTLGVWDDYVLPVGQSGPVGLFVRNINGQREIWYTRPGSDRIGYVLTSLTGRRLGVWETVVPVADSAPWGIAVNAANNTLVASSSAAESVVWNSPYFPAFLYMPLIQGPVTPSIESE